MHKPRRISSGESHEYEILHHSGPFMYVLDQWFSKYSISVTWELTRNAKFGAIL